MTTLKDAYDSLPEDDKFFVMRQLKELLCWRGWARVKGHVTMLPEADALACLFAKNGHEVEEYQ